MMTIPLLLFLLTVPTPTLCTQSSPHPYRLTLPDSTQSPPIQLIGSPAYSQSVDSRGYTVLVDPKDGYVKYATVNNEGEVVPSKFKMLTDETLDPGQVYGIEKYVGPSEQAKRATCGTYCDEEWDAYEWKESGENAGCELFCLEGGILRRLKDDFVEKSGRLMSFIRGNAEQASVSRKDPSNTKKYRSKNSNSSSSPRKLLSTHKNKLINLVIPIKFANHASRPSISKSNLHTLFNSLEPVSDLIPTGSIRQYFSYNSYGNLIIESVIVDWIRVKNTEQYYAGKKSGLSNTFHESLVEALNILDSDPSFDFSDYDRDGNGVADSIFFLHSGYSAEWGGVDCINGNDRSNRVWSHKWKIGRDGNHDNAGWISKSGIRVNDYAVSSAFYGICGKEIARIGVIAHEMGRLLGLPSLYGGHVPRGGNGIGSFGLMGNSWGWDGTQYHPPLLSPWSKMELGWLEPVTITSTGTYSLPPIGNSPKVFRIDLGRDDEFLLLENRAATSFDLNIPTSGLVIWHIDNRAPHYPSENLISAESLGNHAHYRVAVVAADGAFDLEGGLNRADGNDIFGSNHSIGVGFAGENTLYPNSDSYRGGVVTPSGIEISSITTEPKDDPDGHVSFTVLFPGDPVASTEPPSTKPAPSLDFQAKTVQKTLLSTFGANTGSTGIMFDVVAINDVDITSMDLHLRSGYDEGEVVIDIYVLIGSHLGNESNSREWGKVCCSKKVIGSGVGKRTTLDASYFFRKISIASGERMAFYITSDEAIVRYTTSLKSVCCEIYATSLDLQMFEGSGVSSLFGPTAKPRIFNGAIHYETADKAHKSSSTSNPSGDYSTADIKTASSSYFNGNSGGYGIMFDVIPNKNMRIVALDFHTDRTDDVEVNVWMRKGSHQGHERDQLAWNHVCDHVKIKGQGPYTPTLIGRGLQEATLNSFERTALYVTLSSPNIRYTKLKDDQISVGDTAYDLPDFRILVGSGIKGFPFGTTTSPRLWNGKIRYAILDDSNGETAQSSQAAPKTPFNNSTLHEIFRLSTTFASGNKGYGSMFDLSNTVGEYAVVTSIDFHTNLVDEINVVVYTKEGSYLGSEFRPSDWNILSNTSVTGQGYYKRTAIPEAEFQQISIANGDTRAFYISIDKPNLLYSNVKEGTTIGDIVYETNGILFQIGSGLQGTFSDVHQPRLFNGGVQFYHYTSSKMDTAALNADTDYDGEIFQYKSNLGGDFASFGIMFSIQNKHSKPIHIVSLAFHTDLEEDCAVEVYSVPGDYSGKERSPDEWTLFSRTSIQAQGLNRWSKLPSSKMQPVQILAGASQSYYLTLEQPNLRYSSITDVDAEMASSGDKYIEISKGSSVAGYPFGMNMSPRKPVVQVEYKVSSGTESQ